MPSSFNKIPRSTAEKLPASSAAGGVQGESDNDLEAILFSLLGSEKGRQKMQELQAKDKQLPDVGPEGSPVATTVPSESEEASAAQVSPEEAYVLESAQAKSAWSSQRASSTSQPLATEPPVRYPDVVPPPAPGLERSQLGTGLMYAPWAKACESPSPMTTAQLQAQSQLQAQRVLGFRSDKSKGASWTLAWCADFNRVNIHSSLKETLHQMVLSKGGIVVPFWSARGLSKWLQSNGNVPYVMLADLSVLDMSIRSTTLHHRKEKVSKKPVHIFVSSYDDNVEEVKSTPAFVQSVPTSVVSFTEFGFQHMASQAVLMVLGLS